MGKFDGKQISGLVGNLVFRKGKKNSIVQKAPLVVKQTEATKLASKVFGQGSVLASAIRSGLVDLIEENYDGEMVNRLNSPVREVLKKSFDKERGTYTFEKDSFSRLSGFEFNLKSPLINNLWVSLQATLADNLLTITLPKIQLPNDLKFPALTNVCEIKVEVTLLALHSGYQMDLPCQVLEISKSQGSVAAHDFIFEVPQGCLCVAGLSLNYYQLYNGIKRDYNSKSFNPAAIFHAEMSPGLFDLPAPVKVGNVTKKIPWKRIEKFDFPLAQSVE
jgi:hypothetical protein